VERVDGLELLLRGQVALGAHEDAAHTLDELHSIATAVATPSLRAAASVATGMVADSQHDHEAARRCFEDAIDLFEQSGAPYEASRARLQLAASLAALGRPESAGREARAAHDALDHMGAMRERDHAAALLQRLAAFADPRGSETTTRRLTPRELEILRLVAHGMGDKEVAAALALSEHTVHRHIANILGKLDVPSRTAAVAQATRNGFL
jgi:DNA-binding NarL/FixJ family response regulator